MLEEREEWRPAPGFPDYEVSSFGRVRRLTTRTSAKAGTILKASVHHDGYLIHGLQRGGKTVTVLLNRLVCETFQGAPPTPRHHAAHEDGKRLNNRSDNLSWKTPRENNEDRERHGTLAKGEAIRGVLTAEAVRDIRASRAQGARYKELAARHGISSGMVGHIMNGRAWAHVQ